MKENTAKRRRYPRRKEIMSRGKSQDVDIFLVVVTKMASFTVGNKDGIFEAGDAVLGPSWTVGLGQQRKPVSRKEECREHVREVECGGCFLC
jgi:hypothetical protein